jgi:hypothetical protein
LRKKPEKPRVFYHQTIVEKNMNKYPYRTRKKKERNERTNERKREGKKNLGSVPDWHGINVCISI